MAALDFSSQEKKKERKKQAKRANFFVIKKKLMFEAISRGPEEDGGKLNSYALWAFCGSKKKKTQFVSSIGG